MTILSRMLQSASDLGGFAFKPIFEHANHVWALRVLQYLREQYKDDYK